MLRISLKISFVHQMLLMLLSIGFSLLSSSVNGIINLYFPKFHFTNDVEVIKQSIGALLGVFGGFGLMALNGVMIYLLDGLIAFTWILAFLCVLNMALAALAYMVIHTQSSKVFRTYQA